MAFSFFESRKNISRDRRASKKSRTRSWKSCTWADFQPQVREYLTKLRHEAFLEIKPGYVDTGAAPGKNTAWTDPAQLKPETVTKEEVAAQTRRRRLLWMVPIPGTQTSPKRSRRVDN